MIDPTWVAFCVAAGIGAPARYLVDTWVHGRTGASFPWGTLTVNITGSFLLGVVTGLGLYHGLAPGARTIVGTGALGAYTTFSTVTFESVRLVERGAVRVAILNSLGNLAVGLSAASVGLALTAL